MEKQLSNIDVPMDGDTHDRLIYKPLYPLGVYKENIPYLVHVSQLLHRPKNDADFVSGKLQFMERLRSLGIITEYPISLSHVDSVYDEGKEIPLLNLIEINEDNELLLQESLLPVKERLDDVLDAEDYRSLFQVLRGSLTWLYQYAAKQQNGFTYPNLATFEGVEEYIASWLPKQMGTYLGTLHKNHIVHGAPDGKNWLPIGVLIGFTTENAPLDQTEAQHKYESDVQETLTLVQRLTNHPLRKNNSQQSPEQTFLDAYLEVMSID